jgi:hypothetical protein
MQDWLSGHSIGVGVVAKIIELRQQTKFSLHNDIFHLVVIV